MGQWTVFLICQFISINANSFVTIEGRFDRLVASLMDMIIK